MLQNHFFSHQSFCVSDEWRRKKCFSSKKNFLNKNLLFLCLSLKIFNSDLTVNYENWNSENQAKLKLIFYFILEFYFEFESLRSFCRFRLFLFFFVFPFSPFSPILRESNFKIESWNQKRFFELLGCSWIKFTIFMLYHRKYSIVKIETLKTKQS